MNNGSKKYTKEQLRVAFELWFERDEADPDGGEPWGVEAGENAGIATEYLLSLIPSVGP